MKKLTFLLLTLLALTMTAEAANPRAELKSIFAQTKENQGINGDAIIIVYTKKMLIESQPHPLAGGMEDINNVPGSEKKAPAEYPHHRGNANGRNAAKNYWIKITPGSGSRTQPYQGTWADLGGTAVYMSADPYKTMVILKPPGLQSNLFAPGDQIEVTIATTVVDPQGETIHPQKNKRQQIAS